MDMITVFVAVAGATGGLVPLSTSENACMGYLRVTIHDMFKEDELANVGKSSFKILLYIGDRGISDTEILQRLIEQPLNREGFCVMDRAAKTLKAAGITHNDRIFAVPTAAAPVPPGHPTHTHGLTSGSSAAAPVPPGHPTHNHGLTSGSSAAAPASAWANGYTAGASGTCGALDATAPLSFSPSSSPAAMEPPAKKRRVETLPTVIQVPKERHLTVGSQPFPSMRKDGLLYIDKTGFIADLLCDKKISHGNPALFFSRPPKFGKTLLLSTIREMMAAGPLPKGVAAWPGYTPYDIGSLFGDLEVHKRFLANDATLGNLLKESSFVISLNLGGAETGRGLSKFILRKLSEVAKTAFADELLEKSILDCQAVELGIDVPVNAVPEPVSVVILVDAYDMAILEDMQKKDFAAAKEGLVALQSLMVSSKAEYAGRIRKFIVTGSTRIAWSSLFSGANNFTDITNSTVLSDILGFSDTDVRDLIASLGDTDPLKRDCGGTFKHLKDWYNGYCFDASRTVFHPFGVVSYLSRVVATNTALQGVSATSSPMPTFSRASQRKYSSETNARGFRPGPSTSPQWRDQARKSWTCALFCTRPGISQRYQVRRARILWCPMSM
jgi:hypothetical protein